MFIKRVVLFLILSSSLWLSAQEYLPENTIFAFDYHDVLVTRPIKEMIKDSARIIWYDPALLLLVINPFFWHYIYKTEQTMGADILLERLPRQYSILKKHEEDIIYLANNYRPIQGTIQILHELSNRGYQIYLASNILGGLLQKQQERFPTIFGYFSGYYYVDGKNGKKPEGCYYDGLKEYLKDQGHAHKSIVFVDDRRENVEAAVQNGIEVGIHFCSPEQLREELVSLGIRI